VSVLLRADRFIGRDRRMHIAHNGTQANRVWYESCYLSSIAKRATSGGCSVNERKQTSATYKLAKDDIIDGAVCIVRVGKRHPMVLRLNA
jgi:hypothetical protein